MILSCSQNKEKKEVVLYNTHCASCHIAPNIQDLPKDIWKNEILPEMGARLGIRENGYSPYAGLPFGEQGAIIASGIYPPKPLLAMEDWSMLKKYIISLAPDSLDYNKEDTTLELKQFTPEPITIDSKKGTLFTFMEYNKNREALILGNIEGSVISYDLTKKEKRKMGEFGSPITSYIENNEEKYITAIGILNPSDMMAGRLFTIKEGRVKLIYNDVLHRPVHTMAYDFNKDGVDELVVSEFGNLTGRLSLFSVDERGVYQKKVLLNQPGTIRSIHKDMNQDGKEDIVLLSGQGNEGVSILYQEDDFTFTNEKVISSSPVYGSSWFDVFDYNGDGHQDIAIAHGDNADKSYIHKPYHGLRIYLNDGNNNFEEKYFYPMNGATRFVVNDFDKDGDYDFGIVSTFPDYENKPKQSFVYLENVNTDSFTFQPYTFKDSKLGKWFIIDSADIDNDNDDDIILSSFTYPFTPAPKELAKFWIEKNVDIMVLKNNLH